MTYRLQNKTPKNPLKTHQLLTQQELIGQMNKHTIFTRRFVELLSTQIDQMDNKYRKEQKHGR